MSASVNELQSTIPAAELRPPSYVMRLKRLGAFHQTRISFVRSLIRQMAREQWRISTDLRDLDDNGFGTIVYAVDTPHGRFSFVAFSNYLEPSERTDRVIAEKWDTTFALIEGTPDNSDIARLRVNANVQEAGRFDARDLVLSRANKSVRLFDYTIDCLAKGEQPDLQKLVDVGYLLRTTAVYGNGKFGIADFGRLDKDGPFSQPFRAQMLVVYLSRHLAFDLVEHVARQRNPDKAVALNRNIKHFLGVGNSTGLGMAPFLMSHPGLIHQWFFCRETALARVRVILASPQDVTRFGELLERAQRHFSQIKTSDQIQQQKNEELVANIQSFLDYLVENTEAHEAPELWNRFMNWAEKNCDLEFQELLVSLIIELYPDQVDELENHMGGDDRFEIDPRMTLEELIQIVEHAYSWALGVDYTHNDNCHYFWYASEEKEEPRLGERYAEPGAELELPLDIGRRVSHLYDELSVLTASEQQQSVAEFLLKKPRLRGVLARVQTISRYPYGEIRDNTIAHDCLPIDILRCKLAMFGASKFDPKSDRWTRITLFQGAPLAEELDQEDADDWAFPYLPGGDNTH